MSSDTPETEIMPYIARADGYGHPRTVWIRNLYADRHTDTLYWAHPDEADDPTSQLSQSGVIVELNEARIRDLHAQLGKIIAEFDATDRKKGK